MSQPNRCPECGAELPPGALGGLCPKCLLGAGLESRAEPAHEGSRSEAPTTPHSGTFVPPDAASLAAHFPHLEILELLGHGGMGAVYKARQPKLDRMVALKIIRPESAHDPAFAERFNREARMLARLSHPRIVAVYDFGEVSVSEGASGGPPRTLYFFLMEYVEGTNLRQLLQDGELLPQQALAIVPQICEALQFAHDEGVVHRDIKPENILLDKRGRVKIADFGLAKLVASSPQEFTLTGTHQVMGTPRYMAPEQMEGSHAVDHRADIYSLGVVFYEMLTGEVPMGHFDPPSQKVEVDVRLDSVILRTLARQPERRYQHASDVKTDVEAISYVGKAGPPSTTTSPQHESVARWPYAVRLTISLLLLSLAVFGAYSPFARPWGHVFNSTASSWHDAYGFGWWQGMLVCYSLSGAALVVLATLPIRRPPFWRAPLIALFAILTLVGASSFIVQLTNGTLPVRPLLKAASWSIEVDGKTPYTISDASQFLIAEVKDGPYVAIGVAICILLLVALEFVWQQQASTFAERNTRRELVSEPAVRQTERRSELGAARQQVQFPAMGLLVLAIVTLPMAAQAFFARNGDRLLSDVPVQALVWAAFFIPPLAVIVGATKMLQLASYRWAIAASVLVMISPAALEQRQAWWIWWLCVLIGVWSLVVLSKPEVKSVFPKRKGESTANPNSAFVDNAEPNESAEIQASRLVQKPAWGLIITGVISWITIPLAFAVPFIDDMEVMNAAQRAIFRISFGVVPLVVGTIMALAGFRMKRLEGYQLAMCAAVLPIVVLLLKLIQLSFGTLAIGPADLVAAPLGLWVLVVLTRSDVKAAFRRSSPEQEPAPRTARGTLGRAWDEWWAERDRWFTRTVLAMLILVHIVCLGMFLSLSGGGDSSRPSVWHHVGWPAPWFVYERGVEPNVAFRRTINLLSSSIVVAGVGMLAWYAFWRVQLVRDARNARFWQTIGSPTAVLIMWIIAGAAFAWLGVRDAERLYDSMPTEKAASDSQPETEVPDVGKEQSQ